MKIKRKAVTFYVKEQADKDNIDYLKKRDINISDVCRKAIRAVANEIKENRSFWKQDKGEI